MNQISETQTNEQEINGEMSVFLTDSILGPAHRQGIRKEESQSRSVVGFLSMERQLFFGPLARNCRRTPKKGSTIGAQQTKDGEAELLFPAVGTMMREEMSGSQQHITHYITAGRRRIMDKCLMDVQ